MKFLVLFLSAFLLALVSSQNAQGAADLFESAVEHVANERHLQTGKGSSKATKAPGKGGTKAPKTTKAHGKGGTKAPKATKAPGKGGTKAPKATKAPGKGGIKSTKAPGKGKGRV